MTEQEQELQDSIEHIKNLVFCGEYEMAEMIEHGLETGILAELRSIYIDEVFLVGVNIGKLLSPDFDRNLLSDKWLMGFVKIFKDMVNIQKLTLLNVYSALHNNTWIHKSCNWDESIKYLDGGCDDRERFHYKFFNIDENKVSRFISNIGTSHLYINLFSSNNQGKKGKVHQVIKSTLKKHGMILYEGQEIFNN